MFKRMPVCRGERHNAVAVQKKEQVNAKCCTIIDRPLLLTLNAPDCFTSLHQLPVLASFATLLVNVRVYNRHPKSKLKLCTEIVHTVSSAVKDKSVQT